MAISKAQGFIGAFDVLMAPIDASGVRGKLKDVGNCTKFAPKANATVKEQKSRKRASAGQVLESVALQEPGELSITLETINIDNLRYCVMGEDAAYSQGAATVTDEVTVAQLDGWVKLANEDISAVVLTNSAATVTYIQAGPGVPDPDYEVNPRLGMYRALSTGTITEAQSLKADYVAAAFTGTAIRGNVKPQLRVYVQLDGVNQVDGSLVFAEFYEAILTPAGEFDFMKDDWNTVELSGKLKTPVGKNEPFIIKQR